MPWLKAPSFPPNSSPSPVVGRSLWADARVRLVRNRAALISIVVLGVIALACIFGPFFTGHPFDRVYPDYVRVPASLAAYPQGRPGRAADRAHRRRACAPRPRTSTIDDDIVRIDPRQHERRPIDERLLAYFERSDLFGPAQGGRSAATRASASSSTCRSSAQHFLFGTDTNGRDLLTRTLMAGRDLAGHRPARDLRRGRDRRASTARRPAISAAGSTRS